MSLVTKIVLGLIAAVGIAALVLIMQLNRFLETPVDVDSAGAYFEVRPGMAFGQISDALAEQGVIDQPTFFRLFARFVDKAGSVHAGEYQIVEGTTPEELLDMFVAGEVRLYSFTIVEGWTFRELVDALNKDEIVVKSMVYEDWPALLESLTAQATHPEGLFLPETYRFAKGTTDIALLRQAYDLMQSTLESEWDARAVNLPVDTPYEALVLASIIEKETALASERPRISGVFVRRLEQRMRLQTDPTVIYGIGEDFDGNLTRQDMRTDTPYNTYTRGGLPPTPIALPGRAAINAALNPTPGTELYFVATGLGDGSHKFSNTMAEHNAALQEYLARQRASRNR